MQDGASSHFAIVAREWLNAQFLEKWMSHRGSHEWPARSPDLTHCNFFLLGWLNEQVYSTKPRNLEKRKGRMHEVKTSILQKFLVKSDDAVHGRLKKVVANDGAHIEF